MSLQRDAMRARLAKLPQLPPLAGPTEGEDAADDEAADSLPPLGAPRKPPRSSTPSLSVFSTLSAEPYFHSALDVDVPALGPAHDQAAVFRVYYTPPVPSEDSNGTVFVLHHGAGYSGLSFACVAGLLREMSGGEAGVLTYDCRGHGKTLFANPSDEQDLSLPTLTSDLLSLLRTLFPVRAEAPDLVLVGHSMGGAVCADAVNTVRRDVAPVVGVCVMDVVEGTAMEALSGMMSLINAQPRGFASPEAAIAWHVRNNVIRNPLSARLSVPSMLRRATPEEEAESGFAWMWRIDLRKSQPYWEGWFKGLSGKFVSAQTARMLVLAGTDRLDTELMIAQMQGKFQQVVLPEVGHCLQEDAPSQVAEHLLHFWKRNERLSFGATHIKKVGER